MSPDEQGFARATAKAGPQDPKQLAKNLGVTYAGMFLGDRIDDWHEIPEGDRKDVKVLEEVSGRISRFAQNHPDLILAVVEQAVNTAISESIVAAFCIVDEEKCGNCPKCDGEAEKIDNASLGMGTPENPYRVSDPGSPSKRCVKCGYTWGSRFRETECSVPG